MWRVFIFRTFYYFVTFAPFCSGFRTAGRSVASVMRKKAKPKKVNPASGEALGLSEDVHLHIGGVLVLRFYPNGDIQLPTDPEKRALIKDYLNRLAAELEACS